MSKNMKEALKLALDALDNLMYWDNGKPDYDEAREAIAAIKEALAHPEQEPVAWMSKDADIVYTSIQVDGWFQHDHIPLYTTPPQRTAAEGEDTRRAWVGLTDDEMWQLVNDCIIGGDLHADKFAKAIEAKLKGKNSA